MSGADRRFNWIMYRLWEPRVTWPCWLLTVARYTIPFSLIVHLAIALIGTLGAVVFLFLDTCTSGLSDGFYRDGGRCGE